MITCDDLLYVMKQYGFPTVEVLATHANVRSDGSKWQIAALLLEVARLNQWIGFNVYRVGQSRDLCNLAPPFPTRSDALEFIASLQRIAGTRIVLVDVLTGKSERVSDDRNP